MPVTTRQQSPIASRALSPGGCETSSAPGRIPRPSGPCCSTVRRGPSVTVRPPRSTVTVIGRPSLPRISFDDLRERVRSVPVDGDDAVACVEPGGRGAACSRSTCATSVLGFWDGAPVA